MSSLIHHVRRHADKWVSLLVGGSVFLLIVGPQVLSPSSTTWLRWGDSAQHYYGWEFFRRSPLAQFPLGDSPLFGLGYSSSVVYSDSIPLLAIPLKYLTFWFSGEFQYFGMWLLFCYIAQHYVATLILRHLGMTAGAARLSGILFVIAPVFLYRQTIGGHGHFALAGHFLLLVALLFALKDEYNGRRWLMLMCLASLVQFYLLVMVALLWISTLLRFSFSQRESWRVLIGQVLRGVMPVGVVMLSVGYLSSGNRVEDGFGEFRADLATFVDPQTVSSPIWSRLFRDQPVAPNNVNGTFEGFAFLGAGSLIALGLAVAVWLTRRILRKPVSLDDARPLRRVLPVAVICFVFALSNIVTWRVERVTVPIPPSMEWIGATLRASGRFVWPLAYLVMLGVLFVLWRLTPKKLVVPMAVLLVSLQIFDSYTALREHKERFTEYNYPTSIMQSADWKDLARGKSRLVIDPPQYKGYVWQDFAEFAINNRMSTNASYLSRVNYEQLYESEVSLRNELLTRQIRSDTLYVVLPRSGAYQTLRLSLGERDGRLAPDISAQFVDGMLVIRRDS
jgi:hypothetical protein